MSNFNQGIPGPATLINSSSTLLYGNSASGNALSVQQLGAGNVLSIKTYSGATALFVGANGNVGVGTTSTACTFHANANAAGNPTSTGTGADSNAAVRIQMQSVGLDIGTTTAGSTWFQNRVPGSALATGYPISLNPLGGNVGIGTTNPANNVQIGSPVDVIYAMNPLSQSNVIIFGNSPAMPTYTGTGVGGATLFINSTNAYGSNVGASIALGGRSYNFGGGNLHMTYARIQGVQNPGTGAYAGDFVVETQNSGAMYERMRITSGGGVGIGTTNPSTALEVVGTTRTTTGFQRVTPSTAIAFSVLGSGLTSSSYNAIMNAENDVAGQKLSIFLNGSTRASDGGTNGLTIRNDGGPFTLGSTGYVTTVLSSSDYRNKQNVIPYSNCLSEVLTVPVIKYTYIVTDTPDVQYSGWFAHEIQKVAPYAVRNNKDEVDEQGRPVYQGVDATKLVPILWGAVQELSAENTQLKARLDSLEQRLAAAGL